MSDEKMQASEIIKKYWCGKGLPAGLKICDLVERVRKLEVENEQYGAVIEQMIKEAS